MPYKSRFGIPAEQVNKLKNRYYRNDLKEGFACFDDFLIFCKTVEIRPGDVIGKRDKSKPHGPDNTIFIHRKGAVKEKDSVLHPDEICKGCEQPCDGYMGCKAWKDAFSAYWDKYIHRKLKTEPEKKNREFLRYEHPDLVREGL